MISGSPPEREGAVSRAAHTTGIKKTAKSIRLLLAVSSRLIMAPALLLLGRGVYGFEKQVVHGIGGALFFNQVVSEFIECVHHHAMLVTVKGDYSFFLLHGRFLLSSFRLLPFLLPLLVKQAVHPAGNFSYGLLDEGQLGADFLRFQSR